MPSVILATASYDHHIRFWEAPSGLCYRSIQAQGDSQINRLEITPNSQYLAAAGNPAVKFYEVGTNNPSAVSSFEGHTGNVTSLGFQRDGKWMFTGGEDGTLKIWDLKSPGYQREFTVGQPVNTVTLHPNQSELICGTQDGAVHVYDLTGDKCSRTVVPAGEEIRDVSVATDCSCVIASNNKGRVFIWKLAKDSTSKFDLQQELEAHRTYILRSLLSPDCRSMATLAADSTVKLWKKKGGERIEFALDKMLKGHQRWVWDGAFSADSAYLVTASSDNSARLWDISQGDSIRHYSGHHKAVVAIALKDN